MHKDDNHTTRRLSWFGPPFLRSPTSSPWATTQDFTNYGTVPLRTLQHPAQLVFLHTRREQHSGYHQIFLHTRREHHPGYHQVFLHTRREQHREECMTFKPLDPAFDKRGSEATRTESEEIKNYSHSQNWTGSLKIFTRTSGEQESKRAKTEWRILALNFLQKNLKNSLSMYFLLFFCLVYISSIWNLVVEEIVVSLLSSR